MLANQHIKFDNYLMIPLSELQDAAFKRIPTDAERYAASDHAIAVFVQEALFKWRNAGEFNPINYAERSVMAQASLEDIILFPHEFDDLRLRAAYHGAGLATESDHTIPQRIRYFLHDNLDNYSPVMEYKQEVLPWTYRFKPDALRKILLHDFSIAASDYASGHLHRLSLEPVEEESTEEYGLPNNMEDSGVDYSDYYDDEEDDLEPGDFLEEAFLEFKPGVDAEEIVDSAFLRAGYTPPFDEQWSLDMQRVVQDMIDGDDRLE